MLLPILAGAMLGALLALYARTQQGAGEMRLWALGLLVAAVIYVGLALAAGNPRWLMVELVGVAVFGTVAWFGLHSAAWLAVGWLAHVGWDVGLHLDRPQPVVRHWYPLLCVGFDLLVAGVLVSAALSLRRSRPEAA
jgi:hypothetical protein